MARWFVVTDWDRTILQSVVDISNAKLAAGGDRWIKLCTIPGYDARPYWARILRLQRMGLLERECKASRFVRITARGRQALTNDNEVVRCYPRVRDRDLFTRRSYGQISSRESA